MKIGKLVHFEPWGDEPLLRISKREVKEFFIYLAMYVIIPIFLLAFPSLLRFAVDLLRLVTSLFG